MLIVESDNAIAVRFVQLLNVEAPILVTALGNIKESRPEYAKAQIPMAPTVFGICR